MSIAAIFTDHMPTIMNRLGEEMSYTPNGGSPVMIHGIFYSKKQEVHSFDSHYSSLTHELRINNADIVSPKRGDKVQINTVTYTVIEKPEPFPNEWKLTLREQTT